MLYIFRKVRQSLIATSTARKYFLYATGEIALVVIGILIALQINNWNEHRKEQKLAWQYIEDMHTDLKTSVSKLQEVATHFQEESRAAQYILEMMDTQDTETFDSEKIFESFSTIGKPRIVINGHDLYNELSNSGQISIVKDRKLLDRLDQFYIDYEQITTGHNEQAVIMKRNLQMYWSANTLLEEWKSERATGRNHINQITRLLHSREFYQLLIQNLISADADRAKITELLRKAESLILFIEQTYPNLTSPEQ